MEPSGSIGERGGQECRGSGEQGTRIKIRERELNF